MEWAFCARTILYTAVVAVDPLPFPAWSLPWPSGCFDSFFGLSWIFGLGGLAGFVFVCLVFLFTKSFGTPYLWPLVPFNGPAFLRLLFRTPVPEVGGGPCPQRDESIGFRR